MRGKVEVVVNCTNLDHHTEQQVIASVSLLDLYSYPHPHGWVTVQYVSSRTTIFFNTKNKCLYWLLRINKINVFLSWKVLKASPAIYT
jgi:hypothetical protein